MHLKIHDHLKKALGVEHLLGQHGHLGLKESDIFFVVFHNTTTKTAAGRGREQSPAYSPWTYL